MSAAVLGLPKRSPTLGVLVRLFIVAAFIRLAYCCIAFCLGELFLPYDTSSELSRGAQWTWTSQLRCADVVDHAALMGKCFSGVEQEAHLSSFASWLHVWDSVFLRAIALRGYEYEQHLAFFPGLPGSLLRKTIQDSSAI